MDFFQSSPEPPFLLPKPPTSSSEDDINEMNQIRAIDDLLDESDDEESPNPSSHHRATISIPSAQPSHNPSKASVSFEASTFLSPTSSPSIPPSTPPPSPSSSSSSTPSSIRRRPRVNSAAITRLSSPYSPLAHHDNSGPPPPAPPHDPFEEQEHENAARTPFASFGMVGALRGRDLVSEYEDFDTIDWIREEELHRLEREFVEQECKRRPTWYNKIYREFLRSQAWLYVLLVGATVAVLVSFVDLALEWLIDVRYGFCRTAYFASRASCCADTPPDQPCVLWIDWAAAMGVDGLVGNPLLNWFWYIFYGVLFALVSAWIVDSIAPRAAGSGIPELKALLGGFVIHNFISVRTLFTKLFGVIFSVASGLQLGKEGPLAHIGAATVSLFDWMLPFYGANEVKRREIISAGTACGVGLAFGTPVGGVLFSLEEASYYFPHKTMWRSFFAAAIAAMVLKAINPLHTGMLVSFSVDYPHGWRWFEMPLFIVIGIVGGVFGKIFVSMNMRICEYRKHTALRKFPKIEVLVVALVTAITCYPNEFTRDDPAGTMAILFNACDESTQLAYQSLSSTLCDPNQALSVIGWMAMACAVRLILCTVTAGIRVPSGLFIPSMCIGALMGRCFGIMIQQAWLADPGNHYFKECSDITIDPSLNSCVIPGVYALMGGAAVLAGFTRATISLVVIVFELTGNSDFIVPVMVTVIVANSVGNALGGEGIYEEQILLNELPYLDAKRSYRFNDETEDVMQRASHIRSLPLYGNTLHSLQRFLRRYLYSGYPVTDQGIFIGYVPYGDLKTRVERKLHQGLHPDTPCSFEMKPAAVESSSSQDGQPRPLDFSDLFDKAPIQVSPHTPLRLIFHMFKTLGFRYILVIEKGYLKGMMTKKDLLQYIALSFDKRIRTFLPSLDSTTIQPTKRSNSSLASDSSELRKFASVNSHT